MSLNPKVKSFLESLPTPPPGYVLTLEDLRATESNFISESKEPELYSVEDRRIPGKEVDIPIRIYTPHGQGPYPLLVYFHGGGFVLWSIETHDSICRNIAKESGYKVISVGYRLAPEHPFPAAPEDCYAATKWVAEHADELQGDSARLAVAGDSAGGNLATVVSLMAQERQGPTISKQILIYPITDHHDSKSSIYPSFQENGHGYFLTTEVMSLFSSLYLNHKENEHHPYTSPIRSKDLHDLPSALIITAEYDPLRDEGEQYADRLREAGVSVEAKRYDGLIHAFLSLLGDLDESKEAYRLIAGFLKS